MTRAGWLAGLVVGLMTTSAFGAEVCTTVSTNGWTSDQKVRRAAAVVRIVFDETGTTPGVTVKKDELCIPDPTFDVAALLTSQRLLTTISALMLKEQVDYNNEQLLFAEANDLCIQLAADELAWRRGQLNGAQREAVMYKLLRRHLIAAKTNAPQPCDLPTWP